MTSPLSGWKLPKVAFALYLGQGTKSPAAGPASILVVGPRAYDSTGGSGHELGSAADNEIKQVGGLDDAKTYWGGGSPIARVIAAIFAEHPSATVYGVCPATGVGATRGSWTVQITGTATASGTLKYAVADDLYEVSVASGDTNDTVGAALAAAITANENAPVWASYNSTTDTLTLTAKFYGPESAGITPVLVQAVGGITVGSPSATAGTIEPDWASAYGAVDAWGLVPAYIVPCCNDTTVLTSGATSLKAYITGWLAPLSGKLITAVIGWTAASDPTTALDAWDNGTTNYNEPGYWSQMIIAPSAPAEPWRVAGHGIGARAAGEDSGGANSNWIGLTGCTLNMVMPWSSSAAYSLSAANTFVRTGGSPVWWDFAGSKARLMQSVCCKHLLGSSQSDAVVESTNVPSVCRVVSYGIRDMIYTTFSGFRVVEDDTSGEPPDDLPSRCTSPSLMKEWLLATMQNKYEVIGYVQNVRALADVTSVQIDPADAQALLYELPLDVPRWLLRVVGTHREVGG